MSDSYAPYQLLPELTPDEYAALKADVAAHGVRLAVVIDADSGAIIDGHHRIRAWTELRAEGVKLPNYQRDVRRFASDEERASFVIAANLFRRNLSREQRIDVVAKLREEGWSLRRVASSVGVGVATVHRDLAAVPDGTPEWIEGSDQKKYPARKPRPEPSIVVSSARDENRARVALSALGDEAPTKLLGLSRAEEHARNTRMAELHASVEVPELIEGPSYELRLGDIRNMWDDLPDHSIDAIVTDPPYDEAGVPIYEDLARLARRVLKPGRLVAVYCGHLHLDREIELLARGGLTYVWHGVNVLPGRHSKVRVRKINGRHRSVLLFSAGDYIPRRWIHDAYLATGGGGPETRPLHPWQQAVEPIRHWISMVSKPGETVLDPFLGSGTTSIACLLEERRFMGGDIDPACVETARQRIDDLVSYAPPDDESESEST